MIAFETEAAEKIILVHTIIQNDGIELKIDGFSGLRLNLRNKLQIMLIIDPSKTKKLWNCRKIKIDLDMMGNGRAH